MGGIYIKGIDFPDDCTLLLKVFPDGRVGVPVHLNWHGTLVVKDAEAVPVPEHGDLIDRKALLSDTTDMLHGMMVFGGARVYSSDAIKNAPTVIEAEEEET